MRRASKHIKLDKNHKTVITDLEKQGIEVIPIFEPVDVILLDRDGYVALCEIKIEGNDGQFQRSQLEFFCTAKLPVFVARNAPEAVEKLKTRYRISLRAKDELAALLIRNPAKLFRPGPIHRILEG